MDEKHNDEHEDDFAYCDCECECDDCDNENCDCTCDCECESFEQPTIINKIEKGRKRTQVKDVHVKLPNKVGSKNLPTKTPLKVRIPRETICQSLPNGALRRALCEPESLNLKTVSSGTINICVLVLPGAEVGRNLFDSFIKIPKRVRIEIEAANRIWSQKVNGRNQGVKFNVVNSYFLTRNPQGIGDNVEDFPWGHKDIGKLLFEFGRKVCPEAHVYVFYIKGNCIGPTLRNGARTDAITFRSSPVIIMSNGASSKTYILAHELGHFMYLNNLYGYNYDPDPYPGDPDHNTHPSNLMYPTSDFWPKKPNITPAQIRKALNTRFFYE